MENAYYRAAELIARGQRIVGFTGSGMSAESGIPTFRDPGGIWDQLDPDEVGTSDGLLQTVLRNPGKIRNFLLSALHTFENSKPNPGHTCLAELEKLGKLHCIITQNIDNLHTDAGNSRVIEVHGNLYRARCLACGKKQPLDKAAIHRRLHAVLDDPGAFNLGALAGILPLCPSCKSSTRPDVVMFGESVQHLSDAFDASASCDVMLVLGTSGVVYPAAAMPQEAAQRGAKIIEINPTENCFGPITEVYIKEKSGSGMPRLLEAVKDLMEK